MKTFYLTSEIWSKVYHPYFEIYDPDGWNRKPEYFDHEWYHMRITRKEFLRRMASSTCMFKIPFNQIPF